jgi:Asp-tRNAAsn/Glu-tRNAGln amidotransferase A subunit and related amidases
VPIKRRAFLEACAAVGLTGLLPGAVYAQVDEDDREITADHIAAAETVAGVSFTPEEREMMVDDLNENLKQYEAVRDLGLPNRQRPAEVFDPRIGGADIPDVPPERDGVSMGEIAADRPSSSTDLAYAGVRTLASLLRRGEVTSVELTELYLQRLKQYDDTLHAVITYTEDRAMAAARRADEEIANGNWRGPLHGMPYGAKDLLAVEGTRTTWGAVPYKEQVIDETAAVVERLDEAGAVLVAKLSLGALAWGDVWYDHKTRNPWNIEQGSSGSSAGPAAAVSAGCVPFAIGSETLGSIVSPSTRTGVTGHRPTFGTVSRHGAMTLSWTMDKLGPITRSALDAALVYDTLRGRDSRDPSTVDAPFPFDPTSPLSDLTVGVLESAFGGDYDNAEADRQTLEVLRGLGVDLTPIELPSDLPVGAMLNTLDVEAASAFDELTRTDGIDKMVRQSEDAWPHVFRTARTVPAVEHMQMRRARTELLQQTHAALEDVDVFVSPSFQGGTLGITNLTGHPCVCVPNAFRPATSEEGEPDPPEYRKQPGSISFVGALYRDDAALRLAHAYQQETDFDERRPPVR